MPPRHCLLVVDDEVEVVHSLQDLLRFDYRVLGATRAAEGLDLVRREEVHIVMTDQRMPEMTGVEFLQQLRDTHPDIVRLLFTGFADLKAVIDAINTGNVFRYITKPWDADELQATLRQAAERYDMLAERKSLLAELQVKNQKLEAVNAELKRANELKLGFIKVASHELRTPLTIVLGLSELSRQTPGLADPLRGWLEQIYQGSVRLSRLIDQIVQMLVAGRFDRPLSRCEVSIEQLMRQATLEVGAFLERRQLNLEIEVAPDLGTFPVEADKIRDSLVHLLLNAIKFTPDGGTIRLEGRRLPSNCVELKVRDSGVGIDPSKVGHVFEPFFTDFDVSRHSSGVFEFGRRGLGLGLALVKAFVELHGGHVRVDSTPGLGSTFTMTLPSPASREGSLGGTP